VPAGVITVAVTVCRYDRPGSGGRSDTDSRQSVLVGAGGRLLTFLGQRDHVVEEAERVVGAGVGLGVVQAGDDVEFTFDGWGRMGERKYRYVE
jgi:hypothetical protein